MRRKWHKRSAKLLQVAFDWCHVEHDWCAIGAPSAYKIIVQKRMNINLKRIFMRHIVTKEKHVSLKVHFDVHCSFHNRQDSHAIDTSSQF